MTESTHPTVARPLAIGTASLSMAEVEELRARRRRELLHVLVPVSVAVGMAWYILAETEFWTVPQYLSCFVLVVFPLMGWTVAQRWERIGYGTIVMGYLSLALIALYWHNPSLGICLLVLPTALAWLLMRPIDGVLLSGGATLLILFVEPGSAWRMGQADMTDAIEWISHHLSLATRLGTAGLVWGVQGMLWASGRYAAEVIAWSEAQYGAIRDLLETARDQRVQLKQAQDDLVQSNEELARLTDRLAAMRRSAEEARRAKEEFVANVSHELRTPLNMILGFSEMIVAAPHTYGLVPPALLADLRVILRNSQHLSSLVDDILDLSQIEAGRWALTKERADYGAIVRSAIAAVRPLYGSKGLSLKLELPQHLPEVFCDRTRIREVVLNLLSNAGRFTDEGGVVVSVRRDGHVVETRVTDTGPGIAPEQQKRLFQPFEQLDRSLARRKGGSGLGLSISKAFVELHGGQMGLESVLGEGTTFYYRLPIDPPVALSSGPSRWFSPYAYYEARDRPAAGPQRPLLPRYVVLESGDSAQRLLARYVDQVDIARATTLAAAIEHLNHMPARALVVNTPSPPETLAQLERQGALPFGTPAIVCSLPGIHEATESLGIASYLVKPISRKALIEALEALDLEGNTVLVVDDEPEALRLYQRILLQSKRHYRVLRASDGRQALGILEDERPDVILTDLVMPNMEGFRLLNAIREREAWRDIPVIVISARDPSGNPIVSNSVSLVSGDGLSVAQVLAAMDALCSVAMVPDRPAHPEQPIAPPG